MPSTLQADYEGKPGAALKREKKQIKIEMEKYKIIKKTLQAGYKGKPGAGGASLEREFGLHRGERHSPTW